MSNFRVAYAPHLGAGKQTAFRDGNVADTTFRDIGGAPGLIFPFEGNLYQIYRNRQGGSLAEGDVLKLYHNNAARVGTASAGAANQITTTQTLTAGSLIDKSVPTYLFLRAGTGVGQRRYITSHASGANAIVRISEFRRDLGQNRGAATLAPEIFSPVPDNTSQYSIVLPWEALKTAAATDYFSGVALATVSDGNWSISQIAGFGLVTCVGSTDALTAGGSVVPSGTAGQAKGFTTAGETAADARVSFGMALDAFSGAAALRHVLLHLPKTVTFWPLGI